MLRADDDAAPTAGRDRMRRLADELTSVLGAMITAQSSLVADVRSAIGSSEEHVLKVGSEMARIYDATQDHMSDLEVLRQHLDETERDQPQGNWDGSDVSPPAPAERSGQILTTVARVMEGGRSIGESANLALTHLQFQDRMRQCLDYVVRHQEANIRILQALTDGLARCDGAADERELAALFAAARAPELEPDKHKPHEEPAGTGEVEFF
jgi:hypothetical protein